MPMILRHSTSLIVIFGKIAKLPSEGVPYPIFVFAAMLPWTFFATAFADASNSLIGNAKNTNDCLLVAYCNITPGENVKQLSVAP
jgi:ABC-type polysaccharide/polyol phosphate export permease